MPHLALQSEVWPYLSSIAGNWCATDSVDDRAHKVQDAVMLSALVVQDAKRFHSQLVFKQFKIITKGPFAHD